MPQSISIYMSESGVRQSDIQGFFLWRCHFFQCHAFTAKESASTFWRIHLSFYSFSYAYPNHRVIRIGWSLCQFSQRYGSPICWRANTYREITIHTHIHNYSKFRITNEPKIHVFGLWEDGGVVAESLCIKGEKSILDSPV